MAVACQTLGTLYWTNAGGGADGPDVEAFAGRHPPAHRTHVVNCGQAYAQVIPSGCVLERFAAGSGIADCAAKVDASPIISVGRVYVQLCHPETAGCGSGTCQSVQENPTLSEILPADYSACF